MSLEKFEKGPREIFHPDIQKVGCDFPCLVSILYYFLKINYCEYFFSASFVTVGG